MNAYFYVHFIFQDSHTKFYEILFNKKLFSLKNRKVWLWEMPDTNPVRYVNSSVCFLLSYSLIIVLLLYIYCHFITIIIYRRDQSLDDEYMEENYGSPVSQVEIYFYSGRAGHYSDNRRDNGTLF